MPNDLLREVDHRAKNALALVQGIVRLTRRDDVSQFADAVQGRVDALARAHAMLSEYRWRTVPLDQVVRGEPGALGMQRVRIGGDGTELSAAQVQSVALLLQELAANARRHGAFSVKDSTLALEWRATTRELSIRWTETGGPPPLVGRPRGYGQTMIAAIASRQLRGRVDYA